MIRHFKKIVLIAVCCLLIIQVTAQKDSAAAILQSLQERAKKENKNIFIVFSASWCVWCNRMAAAMNDSTLKPLFDKQYITSKMIVLEVGRKKREETPGAEAYFKKWGGDGKGLPYWVILNKEGTLLANSNHKAVDLDFTKDGQNVGCPVENFEIAYFMRVLQHTSSLSAKELETIKKRFQKIKEE
jgi:thiol-disulfide isomerase/thioredoxin